MTTRVIQTLQAMYDSEINVSITTFWDDGYEVKLGDAMNGYDAEANVKTFQEAVDFLALRAVECYPASVFAKRVKAGEIEL